VTDLADLLVRHLAGPFPDEVEKGRTNGLVDPVMIAFDIYGWALASSRKSLNEDGRRSSDILCSLSPVGGPFSMESRGE
jgi:hypothetical protein